MYIYVHTYLHHIHTYVDMVDCLLPTTYRHITTFTSILFSPFILPHFYVYCFLAITRPMLTLCSLLDFFKFFFVLFEEQGMITSPTQKLLPKLGILQLCY